MKLIWKETFCIPPNIWSPRSTFLLVVEVRITAKTPKVGPEGHLRRWILVPAAEVEGWESISDKAEHHWFRLAWSLVTDLESYGSKIDI